MVFALLASNTLLQLLVWAADSPIPQIVDMAQIIVLYGFAIEDATPIPISTQGSKS